MTCEIDCLSTYTCDSMPEDAEPGAVFLPFVELDIGGQKITGGNSSAPPDNLATISSFEYGFQPGSSTLGATFEILDQGVIMSERIIRAINNTAARAIPDSKAVRYDFGWIVKYCDGRISKIWASELSGIKLGGAVTKVDQSHEGGIVKLKFSVLPPTAFTIADLRYDETHGDESQKITLKEALRALFTQNHPRFSSVQFLNKDGEKLMFKNSDGSESGEGPRGAWPVNQQNSLAAARTWLSSIVTKNDKGVLICYDQNKTGIVFQEDVSENKCCVRHKATYIVNGGNCSPVLEFSPSISWGMGNVPGAGGASGGSSSGSNTEVKPTLNANQIEIQQAGTQTSPAIQQHENMWRVPEDQAKGAAEGNAAHLEANAKIEKIQGFTAQLKIMGNPRYSNPMRLIGQTLSIVVINPFNLKNSIWITNPNCNPILSNKNYMIQGVSHQISNGSYVTTFQLTLSQPHKDIGAKEGLGYCGATFNGDIGASEAIDANE